MDETLNNHHLNPQPNEWERVSEQTFNRTKTTPSVELKETSKNIDDSQNDKQKSVGLAREKVLSAIEQKSSEKHEREIETTQFMGVQVSRELLGEEKIIIEHVSPRVSDGLFGVKKKKDAKKLERLLGGIPNRLMLEEELTPQVAYDYLERRENQIGISDIDVTIIESLPLEEQEKILRKRYGSFDEYAFNMWPNCNSVSWIAKTVVGASNAFIEQPSINPSDTQLLVSLVELLAERVDEYEYGMGTNESLFNGVMSVLESNPNATTEDKKSAISKIKIHLAAGLLPEDYFREHFDKIVDKEYLESNQFSLSDAYVIYKKLNTENSEEVSVLGALPPHLHEFIEKHGDLVQKGIASEMNDKTMEETIALVDKYSKVIPDENALFAAITSGGEFSRVIEMMSESEIDDSLAEGIHKYLRRALTHDTRFKMPVENLGELRDYSAFFEKHLQKELEDSIDLDPEYARELLSLYYYGQSTDRIGQNLVALGVIEISSLDRRNFETEAGYDAKTRRKIRVNDKKLQELQIAEEMTDAQKCLVLDAIDLICCKKEDLLDRFFRLKGKKDPDDTELGDMLNYMRTTKMKEVSANYSGYMREAIGRMIQNAGETTYDGKTIPIMRLEGDDDFMLLVHHLGAYSEKDSNTAPQEWNERAETRRKKDGSLSGYISTCAIAPGCMKMAATPEQIKSPEEIFYGFSDFGEDTVLYTSEYDLYTEDSMNKKGEWETIVGRQDFIDANPRAIIERTRKATRKLSFSHNEVALDRYSGNPSLYDGRLQPNYLIVFSNDPEAISEKVKKHAAYFGVPILIVDYEKYKKGKK